MPQTASGGPPSNGPLTLNMSVRRQCSDTGTPPVRLRRYPAAYATAYGPAGRRKRAAGMIRCPYCHGGHLAYAATIDHLRGVKRAGCGAGRYWVVIARVVNVAQAVPDAA